MNISPISIVDKQVIDEAKEIQQNKFIYDNKTIRNTLEHAEQDGNNAEEHLERAKKHKNDNNEKELNRSCRSATRDAIDSTEKFLKVAATMNRTDKNKFKNKKGRNEIIQKTHNIQEINKATGLEIINDEDAKFMDSFVDEDGDCNTSHTELSYGSVTPTFEETKRAVETKRKAENGVKDIRNKVKVQSILAELNIR